MKNLKKVFALVVAFTMMLGCVAFAAYPDVTEDTPYASAIATLSALGIVGGDDQGNFNPDSTITRAEFTKIICEIQNMNGEGNKGATAFTDVPADHWASGYINFASSMGIINGMGDGTFVPDGPVTYEQAVKMLVVTLGYEPMAKQMGGYPTGYLAVAQQRGVLKSITAPASTDPAPRNLIAQIVYNALDVPMMVQTGFGSDVTYEVQDGNNWTARTTLLSSKLDVGKLAGEVVANEKIGYGGYSASKDGYITFRADENFKSTDEAWELDSDGFRTYTAYTGETNASDLLGYRCVAYMRETTSNEYEVVAIVPEEGKNNALTIDLADVDEDPDRFIIDDANDRYRLAYFESEDARRSTQVDLRYNDSTDSDEQFVVIWNNQNGYNGTYSNVESLEVIRSSVSDLSARLTMIDWDNDDVYDLIKVDAYLHAIVDTVDVDDGIIRTKGGDRIDLQIDDNDINVSIKDVDGNAVELDSLEENDVLAVITDGSNLRSNDFENMDITVLKAADNVITGTVTEKDGNSDSSKQRVYVDGTEYYLAVPVRGSSTMSDTSRIDVSSEGTFYLTIDGKIFDYDGSKVTDGEIGIILAAADSTAAFQDTLAVKLLTTEGLKTYSISNRIRIKAEFDGVWTTKSFDVSDDEEDAIPASAFENTNFASLVSNVDSITPVDLFDTKFDEIKSEEDTRELAKALTTRVVKFKVDSNGNITQIAPASNAQGNSYPETFNSSLSTSELTDPKTNLTSVSEDEYRASTNRLGKDLTENAVVFSINKNNLNNSKVSDISSLADEAEYQYILFDEDQDGWNAVLDLGGTAAYSADDGFAVVTKVSTANDANDDPVTKVTFVQNGDSEEKVVTFNEDSYGDANYGTDDADYDNLRQGSVFLYQADSAGAVSNYAIIGHINSAGVLAFADEKVKDVHMSSGDAVEYKLAYIYEENGTRIDLAFVDAADGSEWISEDDIAAYRINGVNEYRYNNANRNNIRIEVGSYVGGEVGEVNYTYKGEDDEIEVPYDASYVLVRLVEDEVTDIYSFNSRVQFDSTLFD